MYRSPAEMPDESRDLETFAAETRAEVRSQMLEARLENLRKYTLNYRDTPTPFDWMFFGWITICGVNLLGTVRLSIYAVIRVVTEYRLYGRRRTPFPFFSLFVLPAFLCAIAVGAWTFSWRVTSPFIGAWVLISYLAIVRNEFFLKEEYK